MNASERFSRQIMLPEIGPDGQERMARSSVLVVGLGGLGCPVALYLAGAGVGRIGLADADTVSESNLHRQLLYSYPRLGMPKAEAAALRLAEVSPGLVCDIHPDGLTPDNARDLVAAYDLVMDCCDNFATRYLLSDVCAELGRPWVFGSIKEFGGMASTFMPGGSTAYSDLFPDRNRLAASDAASAGVIGPVPGVIGSIQAAEAMRILVGARPALDGKLLTMDLRTMEFRLFDI